MLLHSRKGITTRTGVIIVIVLLAISAGAYAVYYFTLPTGCQFTPQHRVCIGIVYDTGGKGDKSFNDMAYNGVVNAANQFGIIYRELGSTSANDYTPNIEQMVSAKVNLTIAVGFLMDDDVKKEATKYPQMHFAQVDGDVYNMSNVVAIKYQEHIGSALVGALAAAMTKNGTVGFIGGMDIGIIHKFWHGWQYGVAWGANYLIRHGYRTSNVTILPAQYTGTTPAAWGNTAGAKAEATTMIQQGADIIFAAAGGAGTGMFDEVGALDQATSWNWNVNTRPPYFAIGVDANQDYYGTRAYFVNKSSGPYSSPSFVLTSEMKRVDTGVYDVIKSVVDKNYSNFYNHPEIWAPSYWTGPTAHNTKGVFLLGLAQNAVGPSPMSYTSQYLTPAANAVLAQLTKAILNGTAVVPENYNS